jgi:peptidoglycan-N-acetylglucosamine deacetylase
MFVTAYVDEAECADALARKLLGRAPAEVMLLHEADVTTMFLGDLVKSLRAHGWKIVSPDTSYRDPIYRIKTKELPAEGPLLTELARDRGIDTPTTCRWNDDAFANSEFDRRVLHRPS